MNDQVKINDLTITLRNTEYKMIHPAIGVVDYLAYVGVWYPCEITDEKGHAKTRDLLFLVTSDRKRILANDTILGEKNWRLEYKPLKFFNRWTMSFVQRFLEGEAVEPIDVLDHVIEAYRSYIEFQDSNEHLYHALWDIGTYFHHLFASFPYLYVGGSKRTGKTKTLTIHSLLAHNALFSNNMSISSIYRLIQNSRATLLIDETEKLSGRQMSERTLEFRSIILSGYKKGSQVFRTEKTRKGELQTQAFEVYSPKCIANIEGLEDVLEDRCKTTIQRRSCNNAIMNREPDFNSDEWPNLRNQLYLLFLTHWKEVKAIYDELSEPSEQVNVLLSTLGGNIEGIEDLVGREFELWKPILALAVFFDRHSSPNVHTLTFTSSLNSLCSSILKLAVDSTEQRKVENMTETGESILVQVLSSEVQNDNYYKVKALRDKMAEAFDETQLWLTTKWVGSCLKRLGFKEKRRVGTGYEYKLTKDVVQDLAVRMGINKREQCLRDRLDKIRQWIAANKEQNNIIDITELTEYLKASGEPEPTRIIEILKNDGCIFPLPIPGKLGIQTLQEVE